MKRNIGIYGMTCAGKSTLGMELSKLEGSYISFGDIRRDEVASGSPLGKEIERILGLGNAIPAALGCELIKGRFRRGLNFVSGFPISEDELSALAAHEARLDGWMLLLADEAVIRKRFDIRAECPECHQPGEVGEVCPAHSVEMCERPDANCSEMLARKRLFERRIEPFLRSGAMRALPNISIDTTMLARGEVLAVAQAWLYEQFNAPLEEVSCSSI